MVKVKATINSDQKLFKKIFNICLFIFIWMFAMIFAAANLQAAPALIKPTKSTKIPEVGFDYREIAPPLDVQAQLKKNPKVEITEFFWYGCPHCFALEPHLNNWLKLNQKNVVFKRVPVAFSEMGIFHQKLYYGLEQMKLLERTHPKIFEAFHVKDQKLSTWAELEPFAKANQLDINVLKNNINGFTVASQIQKANQSVKEKQIDGVPALMIEQRYITSSQMAGGRAEALAVVDYLVKKTLTEKQKSKK